MPTGEPTPARIQIAFARGGVSALLVAAEMLNNARRLYSSAEIAGWLRDLAEQQTSELVKLGAADADRAVLEALLREALSALGPDAQASDLARRITHALASPHPAFPGPRAVP